MKIEINSLTYAPEYPKEFVSRVEQIIAEVKKEWDAEKWDVDHTNSKYKGNRYNNKERILQVILGNIRSSHENEIRKNGADWETANNESFAAAVEWSKHVTDEELKIIVNRALEYSASADYWYTFEKEWD